jgi:hypothetical protein
VRSTFSRVRAWGSLLSAGAVLVSAVVVSVVMAE